MRVQPFHALATVSLVALVSAASATLALAGKDLGLLKPADRWRVGTVYSQGAPYCATVNKFSDGTVLAVARDTRGQSSLALNFTEKYFIPAQNYPVTVTVGKQAPKNFDGRGSGERSYIVQIGPEQNLMSGLNAGAELKVVVPAVSVTFDMAGFDETWRELVECSNMLMSPEERKAVAAMQEAAEKPVDRAAAEIGQPKTAAAPAAAAEKEVSALDQMEDQLEAEQQRASIAAAETERQSREKIAELEKQRREVSDAIDSGQKEAAAIETEKKGVERKLLGSMGDSGAAYSAPVTPKTSGVSAQELERQQLSLLGDRKLSAPLPPAGAPQPAIITKADKETEIDVTDDIIAAAPVAEVTAEDTATAAPAGEIIAAPAGEIIAAPTEAAAAPRAIITKTTPPETPAVVAAVPELSPDEPLPVAEAQRRMLMAATGGEIDTVLPPDAEKRGVEAPAKADGAPKVDDLRVASDMNKISAPPVDLLAAAPGADRGAEIVQATPPANVPRDTLEISRLREELARKSAEAETLKKNLEEEKAQMGLALAASTMAAEMAAPELEEKQDELTKALDEKQQNLARLQQQMQQLEAAKAEEAARAAKAQAELDTTRRQLAEMQKTAAMASQALVSAPVASAPVTPASAPVAPVVSSGASAVMSAPLLMSSDAPSSAPDTAIIAPQGDGRVAAAPVAPVTAEPATENLSAPPASLMSPALREDETAEAAIFAEAEKQAADAPRVPASTMIAEAPAEKAEEKAEEKSEEKIGKKISAPLKVETPKPVITKTTAAPLPVDSSLPVENVKTAEDIAPKPAPDIVWDEQQAAEPPAQEIAAAEMPPAPAPVEEAPVAPPVIQPAAPAKSARNNRAAAFLDRIMGYHRPGGAAEPAPAPTGYAAARAESLSIESGKTAEKKTAADSAVAGISAAVTAALPPAGQRGTSVPPAAAEPAPVPQKPLAEMSADVMKAERLSAESRVVAADGGPLTLEALLGQTPAAGARFVPVDAAPGEVVRQWSVGKVNGMYEQLPSAANVSMQAESYIDRYREDCPGFLNARLSAPRAVRAGQLVDGSIVCNQPGNSYSISISFLQDGSGVNTVLHTGYPADATTVSEIGARISQALSGADTFIAPGAGAFGDAAPRRAAAASVPAPAPAPVPAEALSAPVPETVPVPAAVFTPEPAPVQLRPPAPPAAPVFRLDVPPLPPSDDLATQVMDELGTVVIE